MVESFHLTSRDFDSIKFNASTGEEWFVHGWNQNHIGHKAGWFHTLLSFLPETSKLQSAVTGNSEWKHFCPTLHCCWIHWEKNYLSWLSVALQPFPSQISFAEFGCYDHRFLDIPSYLPELFGNFKAFWFTVRLRGKAARPWVGISNHESRGQTVRVGRSAIHESAKLLT